jgi:23S rRNA pseudouridine1911/1915/1917 synthase
MILAKNADSLSWLQKQFSQRRTKKQYIAITQGIFKQLEAEIDMPIERNPKKPQTFRVGSNGKSASTTYKVIDSSDKYSSVSLRPFTGRTHQLRVHLAQLGHPIVGDQLYGGESADRLYLHAESLEITLPDKSRKTFSVKVPKQFNNFMESK